MSENAGPGAPASGSVTAGLPPELPDRAMALSIGAVERDTGLSKDVLRMWERRYGFPLPSRDRHGERVYPADQVTRLRLIKRLMDRGHRPGKIISMPTPDLEALSSAQGARDSRDDAIEQVLELIRRHQLPELRQHLQQLLLRQGLQRFVTQTVGPLTVAVGEAWVRGEFAVFEEHLYTEQIQSVLRNAIASALGSAKAPRVVLTSFPTEQHTLGLLMVEAMLVVEGATCIPLGTETPGHEILRAVQAHRADVVALSFSAAFPERQAASGLRELRSGLPKTVGIWAGGSCVHRIRRGIDGVTFVKSLDQVGPLVTGWRQARGAV